MTKYISRFVYENNDTETILSSHPIIGSSSIPTTAIHHQGKSIQGIELEHLVDDNSIHLQVLRRAPANVHT